MSQENPSSVSNEKKRARAAAYWRANVRLISVLLSIWFFVSIICGVLLVDVLNAIRIGSVPLGFWIAQQGSIYTFVLIILVYTILMDRLERKWDAEVAGE